MQPARVQRNLAPEPALDELRKLQQHPIHLTSIDPYITGRSRLSDVRDRVFIALELKSNPLRWQALW